MGHGQHSGGFICLPTVSSKADGENVVTQLHVWGAVLGTRVCP